VQGLQRRDVTVLFFSYCLLAMGRRAVLQRAVLLLLFGLAWSNVADALVKRHRVHTGVRHFSRPSPSADLSSVSVPSRSAISADVVSSSTEAGISKSVDPSTSTSSAANVAAPEQANPG